MTVCMSMSPAPDFLLEIIKTCCLLLAAVIKPENVPVAIPI